MANPIGRPGKPFWQEVNCAAPNACWEWLGTKCSNGYGRKWCGGKLRGAHRISYESTFGPIPPGLCVLHICDNPDCVNPGHLRLGTQQENITDATRKGRVGWGERNHHAKLTVEQVREIRAKAHLRRKDVAAEYGISASWVNTIVSGKKWTRA